MKNKIRMYFYRVACKRYTKNKHNKLIDEILFYIVNELLKERTIKTKSIKYNDNNNTVKIITETIKIK